jgi:hypothetical protein
MQLGKACNMNQRHDLVVGRRQVIHALTGLAAATIATTVPITPAAADSESDSDKRKARYRADSEAIQTFYRVNRYPER